MKSQAKWNTRSEGQFNVSNHGMQHNIQLYTLASILRARHSLIFNITISAQNTPHKLVSDKNRYQARPKLLVLP